MNTITSTFAVATVANAATVVVAGAVVGVRLR